MPRRRVYARGMVSVGMRLRLLLALFLSALFVMLPTTGGSGAVASAVGLGVMAAAVVCTVVVVGLVVPVAPAGVRAISLRERARLVSTVRLRDPDARGRTRPRAPSRGGATA